jgi:tetratricopeptide (TPR) repeat protein
MIPPKRIVLRAALLGALCLGQACSGGGGVGPPPRVEADRLDPEIAAMFEQRVDAVLQAPHDPEARARLGMAYEANAILGAAESAYEQAAALAPENARWPYHVAHVRAEQGDLAGALRELDRVEELDSGHVATYWRRGDWLLELGRLDEAEESYRHAVELDGAAVAPRVGMARVYMQRGQDSYAVQVLQGLLGTMPDHPYLHQLLGTAYRQLGRMEDARHELALAANPRRPRWPDPWIDEIDRDKVGFAADFQRALALLGARRHAEAIPILERLRTEEPDNVVLLSNLGAAYVDAGRTAEGLTTLQAALQIQPDYFSTHLNLSSAYERSGDLERALEHAELAIRANPKLGAAYVKQGLLLARLERWEEALDALDAARRYDARTTASLVLSGRIRSRLGRWQAAAEDYAAAVEQAPNDLAAWLGYALAAAEAGDAGAAQQALAAAERLAAGFATPPPELAAVRARLAELGMEAGS